MSRPTVLVIGAGISGLSAAIYAALNEFDVTVLEHGTEPGGVCASWQRGAFTFDGCIHWLMGVKPGSTFWQAYREVGALDGVEYYPLDRYLDVIDESHGRRATIWADLDRFVDSFGELSASDRAHLSELVADTRALEGMYYPMENAPELGTPLTTLRTMWRLRSEGRIMMKYRMTPAEWAKRLEDPFVTTVLCSLFGESIPLSFGMMILAELEDGSLARVRGGSSELPRAMARRLERLGGVIRYRFDVEEIVVEHDRAVGVRSSRGEELRADHVISTAPGYATIFHMLGGHYANRAIRERYTTWKTFPPVALVSFGADATWPDVSPSSLLMLEHPLLSAHHQVDRFHLRVFHDDDTLAPAGATGMQAIVETPFDYWHDLHHKPRAYARAKQRLAADVLERIEPHLPGVTDAVVETDIATPYTFWRYARSWRGAYEGFLPTADNFDATLEKTLPGLSHFYMGGQWTTPGGGVPPAVLSGRHVVQLLCRDTDRTFTSEG